MIRLDNLKKFNIKKKKRVGRGNASGHGTYSTRGIKGQKSRSGGRGGLKIKGLKQVVKALPKMGGFNSLKVKPNIINFDNINAYFKAGEKINPQILLDRRLINSNNLRVKILSKGELKLEKLEFEGCQTSKGAREKIEKMDGHIKP